MGRGKTAETILNATIRLFIEDGVKKTTMDDIAESSMVSKVTVYKYFVDKDALYEQVGERLLSGFLSKIDAVIASEGDLPRKFGDMIGCVTDFTDSGQYDLCGELSRYSGVIEEEVHRCGDRLKSAMLALIDEGLKHGMFHDGLDREMVYYYVDMGVSYYQHNRQYRGRMAADAGFRERFIRFLLSSVFVKADAGPMR